MRSTMSLAADSGAILAAHAALQLVHRRRLRPADDAERDGRVRAAAKAADFEVAVPSVEGLAQSG